MDPNTNVVEKKQKVIFYIGDTLSDKTRLNQKHNYKTTISQHPDTQSHTINICSEANITIHRQIPIISTTHFDTILKLLFTILEKIF